MWPPRYGHREFETFYVPPVRRQSPTPALVADLVGSRQPDKSTAFEFFAHDAASTREKMLKVGDDAREGTASHVESETRNMEDEL